MMLVTRLSKIKGHRIFREFAWQAALPDFARFNLIYGWNGAGKTTLSNLFRHLQEKRAVDEGEVQFRIGDRTVGQNDIPTAVLPQVRVFNRDTLNRSIFEVANGSLPPVYFPGRRQRRETIADRTPEGSVC
ncbi:AAA family ATPase [Undibacterium arcticum]